MAGDVLDPGQVYIAGHLPPGPNCVNGGNGALAHWSTPDVAATGLDCSTDPQRMRIRPTDGRLLYIITYEHMVREFVCDECPFVGPDNPETPKGNDPELATPCDFGLADDFRFWPDGSLLYHCDDELPGWYDADGALRYSDLDDALVDLGYQGRAITRTRIIDMASGLALPFAGAPASHPEAVRALPSGGFMAAFAPSLPSDGTELELWHIEPTSEATLIGSYSPLPADSDYYTYSFEGKMDAEHALYQVVAVLGTSDRSIVRRTLGRASETVYSETTMPLVQYSTSALVTGP